MKLIKKKLFIRAQYDNSPYLDIQITNIVMDTADVRNTGLGSASYVEECECPSGKCYFNLIYLPISI